MCVDMNGVQLTEKCIVLDYDKRLLCVDSINNGIAKCFNGNLFVYWKCSELLRVYYSSDVGDKTQPMTRAQAEKQFNIRLVD